MISIAESSFGFPSNATPNVAGPTPQNTLKRKSSNELTNEGIVAAYITYQNPGDVPQYLTVGCLAFIETPTTPQNGLQTRGNPINSIRSLAGMNAWLYNDAVKRSLSGVALQADSKEILDKFCFLGVVDNPDWNSRKANLQSKPVNLVNVVVGRGAVCHNYWAGDFSDLLPNVPAGHNNFEKFTNLWLLLSLVPCDKLHSDNVAVAGPTHAWQFVPYSTKRKLAPHESGLTLNHDGQEHRGVAIYVGKTLTARGSFLHKDTFTGLIKQCVLQRSTQVRSDVVVSRIPLCEICLS